MQDALITGDGCGVSGTNRLPAANSSDWARVRGATGLIVGQVGQVGASAAPELHLACRGQPVCRAGLVLRCQWLVAGV
jgi:hypothetical protein